MGKRRRVDELEELYRRDFAAFVRVAAVVTGSVAAGHEAVQEAFARALESIDRFRGESPLEAWVWRIVVNTAKSSREPGTSEQFPDEDSLPSAWNGHPEHAALRAWVASLPERQRLAVFLRYWADLDYRSIASVLEIEVGTVSATLSAAHRSLRRSLEEASA